MRPWIVLLSLVTGACASATEPANAGKVGGGAVERVELFDGDVLVETKAGAPFEFRNKFGRGIHPLYAVLHAEGRKPAYTRRTRSS